VLLSQKDVNVMAAKGGSKDEFQLVYADFIQILSKL
jgi:hypothetical protein